MMKQGRSCAAVPVGALREAVGRLADTLRAVPRHWLAMPAAVPVREPSAEELRRYVRSRRAQRASGSDEVVGWRRAL